MLINDIYAGLTKLDPEHLQEVILRCHALLAINPTTTVPAQNKNDANPFYEGLYTSIADEVKKRTGSGSPPYRVFCKMQQALQRIYITHCKTAQEANAGWFPEQSRSEQASMIRLYAQLIVANVEARELPLVWSILANTVGDLAAIVDQSFPGYAGVGLLSYVQALRTRPETAQNRPVVARPVLAKG